MAAQDSTASPAIQQRTKSSLQTFRVIEGRQTFDIRARSVYSLVRRRYGRTAQIHYGGAHSPHYTITRTDKYGFHIVGQIVK